MTLLGAPMSRDVYRVMRNLARANIMTFHLGNGCSATALSAGNSIDTQSGPQGRFSPSHLRHSDG
jgi:acetate kinase